MLHIRCNGIVYVTGRRVRGECLTSLHQRETRKGKRIVLVADEAGKREHELSGTITELHVTDSSVVFRAEHSVWRADHAPDFHIVLKNARVYDLPDMLAATVHIKCADGRCAVRGSLRRRSVQNTLDLAGCEMGTIAGINARQLINLPPQSRADLRDVFVGERNEVATDADSDWMAMARMRMITASLIVMPIAVAADDNERVRIMSLVLEQIGMRNGAMMPVTDDSAPEPATRARIALGDRVERLQLLAAVRGTLYAAETDLLAWLRAARPRLAERIGAHELGDVVAEAAAQLERTPVVHAPAPAPTPLHDGETPCNLCCEYPPSIKVCARCADGVFCAGCTERLVLDTARAVCPLCRGALGPAV